MLFRFGQKQTLFIQEKIEIFPSFLRTVFFLLFCAVWFRANIAPTVLQCNNRGR